MEGEDCIATSGVPPGEGPRVAGRTSPSSKKRVRDLLNCRVEIMPEGQKLVPRVTRCRKGEGTKEFNPAIFNKRIYKPPGNGRDRRWRERRKKWKSKGKGRMVQIPGIQEGDITGQLNRPAEQFCGVDRQEVDHRGTRLRSVPPSWK